MAKQHFALMENDHYTAKNNLQKDLRERVREDFSNTLVNNIEHVVESLEALINYYNSLHPRCKPLKGEFYSNRRYFNKTQFRIEGLFAIMFYEVKEVSNA